jgi:hypothetical protein
VEAPEFEASLQGEARATAQVVDAKQVCKEKQELPRKW